MLESINNNTQVVTLFSQWAASYNMKREMSELLITMQNQRAKMY